MHTHGNKNALFYAEVVLTSILTYIAASIWVKLYEFSIEEVKDIKIKRRITAIVSMTITIITFVGLYLFFGNE